MRPLLLVLALALTACETAAPPPGGSDAGPVVGTDAAAPATDGGALPDAGAPPPGTDAGLDSVDAGPVGTDAGPMVGGTCPPTGPYGSGEGDVADDLVLMDCDGTPHTLHELCERRAVWLFEFADWCPPCRSFARDDVNDVYARFAGPDFGAYMVISEDSSFGEPSAATCAEIRDRYGITMPVLFDPGTAFEDHFGVASNEVNIVLGEGAVIEWKGRYAASQVEDRIAAVLGE